MSRILRYRPGRIVLVLGPLVLTSTALAHRPTFSDGSASDANHALEVKDVDLSQVVYHEVTAQAQQLWLTFEAGEDQVLFVQIGVPVIERLADYRPSVAIVGPGFPEVALPFEVPDGLGARIIATDDVSSPRVFHEHFTDTRSWILKEEDIVLPATGRYYLVAYVPSNEVGKLWVSVGRREEFGLADLLKFRDWTIRARRFHEEEVGLGLPRIPCLATSAMLAVGLGFLARGLFVSRRR